ncbi:MAG TPA: YbhB/YbcL family Raf kinase inhibitor-like protein [Acidimicrobiales bacterium]|nr:YbhB/YbcL family Raf kinase inhibitor-like protein [Acidimicrobiales bacterium]
MAERSLTVRSTLFADGDTIPISAAHSMVGGANTSPDLSWEAGPSGTRSYAITCYDPDAPTTVGFSHWVLFDLAPSVTELNAGADGGGIAGFSDWGESRYGGMAPPAGDEPHHYRFTVYALDLESLGVDHTTTYAKFRFLTRGHVLAEGTLTGRFGIAAKS